jgi:(S)-mandelate dehydrogenase
VNLSRAVTVFDVQKLARRRLPRILYDYIEGGVDGEEGLERNRAAYGQHRFVPRYLRDCSAVSLSKTLFGHGYALPFGFAPTGTVGMFRRTGDLMLADAAAAANIPYIMSGASNSSIEDAAPRASGQFWYQLYPSRDHDIARDMVLRAERAGAQALVLTVDVPVSPKRERNLRNGFSHRMRLGPRLVADGLLHPAWLVEYLRAGGLPVFANWTRYGPADASPADLIDFFSTQSPCVQTWEDVARLRELWPRALVIKGILHPQDAQQAFAAGADAIIVSNHGGRQLDRAVSSLEMLPSIRAAVGADAIVMMDGGVCRGSDIAMALCLGADFCFIGRAAVYGVAAAGTAGASRVVEILAQELQIVMRQLGCTEVDGLGPAFLHPAGNGRFAPAAAPSNVEDR